MTVVARKEALRVDDSTCLSSNVTMYGVPLAQLFSVSLCSVCFLSARNSGFHREMRGIIISSRGVPPLESCVAEISLTTLLLG